MNTKESLCYQLELRKLFADILTESFNHNQNKSENVYRCVCSHSNEIMSGRIVGYVYDTYSMVATGLMSSECTLG